MALKENKFVSLINSLTNAANYLNKNTFFAGFVMIVLNIGSRHVDLNLGETVEMFIKKNISREILIFAIFWMGTRDIVTASILTIVFTIVTQYFMNTSSSMCLLSNEYKRMKIDINADGIISDDEQSNAHIRKSQETKGKSKKHGFSELLSINIKREWERYMFVCL